MKKDKELIKYIAIDWGEKRIGLAAADNITWLAMPLAVVYSFDELLDFLAIEQPDSLVVGMPYMMSGEAGATAERVTEFVRLLKDKVSCPVITVDERLSSSAVDSLYYDKKKPEERDAIAAMIILQDYIDGLDKGE